MPRPGFQWGGSFEHELAAKLKFREGAYRDIRTVFGAVALDQRTIRREEFGDGAEEAEAAIRFDGNPDSLRAMLRAASNGEVLTYFPDLDASGGSSYPVVLMNHGPVVAIHPDRDRFGFGEWETVVVLRRIDGGSLATMVQGA